MDRENTDDHRPSEEEEEEEDDEKTLITSTCFKMIKFFTSVQALLLPTETSNISAELVRLHLVKTKRQSSPSHSEGVSNTIVRLLLPMSITYSQNEWG